MKRILLLLALAVPLAASAQQYPNKPIRLVLGYAAGGAMDVSARLVAPPLSARRSASRSWSRTSPAPTA